MSGKDWWREHGTFQLWKMCPTRPDPGEVLLFYLEKRAIDRMEHNPNPLILESMSRRAIVASALGTLAGDDEPTLYRLFGLDPQAYGVPLPAHESIPEVQFSSKKLTDETLLGYQRKLGGLFAQYYTHHAEDTIAEAREWIRRLPTLLPLANTTAQRVHLLALQCRYHELCVGVAREQRKANLMTYHANKAV